MRCPSSVVVNFSHFRLLLWNHWTEFNETWQEARSQRLLQSLCFSGQSEKQDGRPGQSVKKVAHCTQVHDMWPFGPLVIYKRTDALQVWHKPYSTKADVTDPWKQKGSKLDRKQDLNVFYKVCVFRANRKNKMAALASDWLRHFWLLLWKRWTEFNKTWHKARSQRSLQSLCFSGRSKKTIWPPWPLIGWGIFDFSSETAERNSTKLDRKQDLNILYQVWFFSGRSE